MIGVGKVQDWDNEESKKNEQQLKQIGIKERQDSRLTILFTETGE